MSSVSALNARPQTAIVAPCDRPAELGFDLVGESLLLVLVDRLHGVDEQALVAGGAGDVLHRRHVFGEARSAVAAAGSQEGGADARI